MYLMPGSELSARYPDDDAGCTGRLKVMDCVKQRGRVQGCIYRAFWQSWFTQHDLRPAAHAASARGPIIAQRSCNAILLSHNRLTRSVLKSSTKRAPYTRRGARTSVKLASESPKHRVVLLRRTWRMSRAHERNRAGIRRKYTRKPERSCASRIEKIIVLPPASWKLKICTKRLFDSYKMSLVLLYKRVSAQFSWYATWFRSEICRSDPSIKDSLQDQICISGCDPMGQLRKSDPYKQLY